VVHLTEGFLKKIFLKCTVCREGALAGLQCVWHGTAKDRKAIVKSFKTFVTKIATEEYGHLVLLGKHIVSRVAVRSVPTSVENI
jgi:hypothetical protein